MKARAAIIGCGRLGTRIAEELIRAETFSEIGLTARTRRHLDGTLRSLSVWSSIEHLEPIVKEFRWSERDSYEVIVICAKEHYDPRDLDHEAVPLGLAADLRYVGLLRDLPLVAEIGRSLTGFRGTVVVVSNPTDLFTAVYGRVAPGALVVGLGLGADAARIQFMLGSRVRGASLSREQLPMVGMHGRDARPDYEAERWCKIVERNGARQVGRAVRAGLELGFATVRDLGYTLHDCAAVFREDISWLVARPRDGSYRCIALASGGLSIGAPWSWVPRSGSTLEILAGPKATRYLKRSQARLRVEAEEVCKRLRILGLDC